MKKGTVSTILIIALLSLFVGGGLFFYYQNQKRGGFSVFNTDGSYSHISVSEFEDVELVDVETEQVTKLSLSEKPFTLLIFLSSGDCPNCLIEKGIWENINRSYSSKLQVIGIFVRSSEGEAKALSKGFDFKFQTLFDKQRALERRTVLPSITPIKILLNSSRKILLVDGPNPSISAQKDFDKKIRETLNSLNL